MKHLGDQFPELRPGCLESGFTLGCCPVVLALLASDDLGVNRQVACLLELVEHRVKRARPNIVAVAAQFLHHRHAEDRLPRGVIEHVQPHEPAEEHAGQ